MSRFGTIIDDTIPNKYIYSFFVEYFGDVSMKKMKEENRHVIYVARISGDHGIKHRYLFVIIPSFQAKKDNNMLLSNLFWVCLQTRILAEDIKTTIHSYIPRRLKSLNVEINRDFTKGENQWFYDVDELPLVVELLNPEKTVYANKGTLVSAIETFNTIITFR